MPDSQPTTPTSTMSPARPVVWTVPAVIAVVLTPLLLLVVAWLWSGLQLWGTTQCNPGVDPALYPDCRTSAQTWGAVLCYLGVLLVPVCAGGAALLGRRTPAVWLGMIVGVLGFLVLLVIGAALMD